MKPSSALPVTFECDDDPKSRKHLGRDRDEVVQRLRNKDVVFSNRKLDLNREGTAEKAPITASILPRSVCSTRSIRSVDRNSGADK